MMVSFLTLVLASPAFIAAPNALDLGVAPHTLTVLEAPSLRLLVESAQVSADEQYAESLRRRARFARVHKAFGIATWSAMTLTVIFGTIQYYNMYGFFADRGSNPCVTGDAVFGQGQCTGTPVLHLMGAGLTTGLYATTFALSLRMPDPDDASSGNSRYAKRLRLHKALRWVHLSGMVTQAFLGFAIAGGWFGLDRANDYKTLQSLATVHWATGLVTWGALTWAGSLMVF